MLKHLQWVLKWKEWCPAYSFYGSSQLKTSKTPSVMRTLHRGPYSLKIQQLCTCCKICWFYR